MAVSQRNEFLDWKGEWEQVDVTVDSGCARNVAPPGMCPDIPVTETEESKAGRVFYAANGTTIPNMGEKLIGMKTQEGDTAWMKFQVTPVTKALGSVKTLCKVGNRVVFDDDGSYIENKLTKKITKIDDSDGTYKLKVWVPRRKSAGGEASAVGEGSTGERPRWSEGFQRLASLI